MTDSHEGDTGCARGTPVPLVLSRDHEGYVGWWAREADRDEIVELLAALTDDDPSDYECWLHSLVLSVFQGESPVEWLRVQGLRPGLEVRYLSLDIEPSHDSEGIRDGVDVVMHLWPDSVFSVPALTVSVYVDRPARVFTPTAGADGADPGATLAEVIDVALALINKEIADRDKFTDNARLHV